MQLHRQFPIETAEPQIQVMLPVGTHTLQLVVEDDAGQKSDPVQVVIEVKKTASPVKRPPVIEQPKKAIISALGPDNKIFFGSGTEPLKRTYTLKGENLALPMTVFIRYTDVNLPGPLDGLQLDDETHEWKYDLEHGEQQTPPSPVGSKFALESWELKPTGLDLEFAVKKEEVKDQDRGQIWVKTPGGLSNEIPFDMAQAVEQ